jgi:hypothetical protein
MAQSSLQIAARMLDPEGVGNVDALPSDMRTYLEWLDKHVATSLCEPLTDDIIFSIVTRWDYIGPFWRSMTRVD